MEVYTIGFTGRSAADFFGALQAAAIECLVDVRLRNVSQLAGYSKRDDLRYFLEVIVKAGYEHRVDLAPTPELLDAYRSRRITWSEYELAFLRLMSERKIEQSTDVAGWAERRTVLLCSEPIPDRCHRRVVLDYLKKTIAPDLAVAHL